MLQNPKKYVGALGFLESHEVFLVYIILRSLIFLYFCLFIIFVKVSDKMAGIHRNSDTDYYVYRVLRSLDNACDELKPLNNPLTGFLTKKFSNILAEYMGCLRYLFVS